MDGTTLTAHWNGIWIESAFKDDIKLTKPLTLEDALHQPTLFIEIEEEKVIMAKKHTIFKAHTSKDKTRKEYYDRRQNYDDEYLRDQKGKRAVTFLVNEPVVNYHIYDKPTGPLQQPAQPLPWKRWQCLDEPKDNQACCDYHQGKRHPTSQYN